MFTACQRRNSMARTHHPVEYRLLVQQTYDETLKKSGLLFLLETSKQFTNFSYVIDVEEEEANGKEIIWRLRGLKAPSMNMPSTGTAQFQKIYFDHPKQLRFTLFKNSKTKAATEFTVGKNSVSSSRSTSMFLKIYTDEQQFESERANDSVKAELKPDVRRDKQPEISHHTKRKKQ